MPPFASVLDKVPDNMPLYEELCEKQKAAMATGWRWASIGSAVNKTQEELDEVRQALAEGNRQHIVDELGDLLFMSTILCHYADVDPQEALNVVMKKFTGRFGYIEKKAAETGRQIKDVPDAEQRGWYQEFKAREKSDV